MTPDEAEDIKRHFNVIAEGLSSDIRLVAEGHAGLDRKIDGVRQELHEFRGEARSEIRLVAEGQEALRQDAADFRLEVQGEFRDVRGSSASRTRSLKTVSSSSSASWFP